MNKSSKININASSLVGLKAELFKKQEQLKKDRLQPGSSTSSSTSRNKSGESKKPSIWSKRNVGVKGRAEKDLEQLADEREELENARNKLEAKAKFYEKMTKEGYIPDADSDERFLVDFEKKALDKREEFKHRVEELEKEEDIPPPANPDEEWVDYTDTLGRSRRCMRKDLPHLISMDKKLNPQVYEKQEKDEKMKKKEEDLPDLMSNDMYREMLRKKWEEEEEEAAKGPLGSTHYQNVKYDEVRDMGVGYFDFSKDQTQRNEQMETLQLLRDETVDQRERREKLKLKRKAAMKARLEKIKERKRQKGELVEEEEEEEEEEEGEKEKKEDERLSEAAEKETKPSKESKVREWDIGKEPVSAWEQRLTNIRDERPSEFAPPSFYSDSDRKRGPNQPSRYPPPKDYNSLISNHSKEKTVNKPSSAASSEFAPPDSYEGQSSETGYRSKVNLPPPKDLSSVYRRAKEKTVNKPSSAVSSEFAPPDSYEGQSSETGYRSKINLPPPKDLSSVYGRAKEKTVNKPSSAASSEFAPPSSYQEQSAETGYRSRMSLPPPKDFSSLYGRAKGNTGQESSTATLSHWNKPSGTLRLNQPFAVGEGLDNSSRGGTGESGGKEGGEDAIASALSFFRKNAGK